MYKTTAKKRTHRNAYDIYDDLAKIKDAFADASYGMKNQAGKVLSQSFDDIRDKSAAIQGNVSSYVSEKPLKSLGVALLTGIFLGYFLHK